MSQKKPPKKKAARNKPAKKKPMKKTTQGSAGTLPGSQAPLSLGMMESILTGLSGVELDENSPLVQAQDLIYEAWEASTDQHAVTLAKEALVLSADCADAYTLLAQKTANTAEEGLELYRKGVEAGERALGKEPFEEDVGYFWGLIETRPYMRARAGLAQCLWEVGQREEAVDHYWDMLRLNPDDNQGIRDMLMPCLIEMGRDEEAERLFRQFEDDGMAVWMYSRALLDFRKHADSPAANKSLKAAFKVNRHVPAFLLGRKKMPRSLPGLYGFGDDNEAVLYVFWNKDAWESTPGALEWLSAKAK